MGMDLTSRDYSHTDAEVVLGVAGPVGTQFRVIEEVIRTYLNEFLNYDLRVEIMTDHIKDLRQNGLAQTQIDESTFLKRADTLMTAGNELRERRTDILALSVVNSIRAARPSQDGEKGPGGQGHRQLRGPSESGRREDVEP